MSRPIRVVFLVFYFEAWDAINAIYRGMLADPRFDPLVVTIPRKLTGYDKFRDEKKVSAFLDSQGIAHERFRYKKSKDGLARLKELAPDYIFLNYPWQRNYKKNYQIDKLVEFAKVCYVPYFSTSLVQEPGESGVAPHQYTQPTHQLAHMVFLQDADTKAAFDANGRAKHAFLTGTPKIDALIEAKSHVKSMWPIVRETPAGQQPFRLIWAPHHSYADRWLNFGHFNDQREPMLAYAAAHPEIDIVFRPHPFLFGTMTDRFVMTQQEVDQWRSKWDALPNTFTDLGAPLTSLMLASDALLTDGVSFIAEYPLVTGKPAIFWEKSEHWEFSPLGNIAAASTVTVHTCAEVLDALGQAQSDTLPSRSEQIQALVAAVRPQPATAAHTIIDLVAKDFS
ncbi:hypothetical protein [Aurantimicrobium minutum]|uniref:hypothetical protein n=1 Tax=Aurantimicrobium minutum TaxID=708131 RepID=UPI002474514D|nr:hypothetical protein [Aurantimicrobium minutum]MDH6422480.1 hypothetical protein [Aurantimicrobium minutum]